MGYIVHLIIILDAIFNTPSNQDSVSANDVQSAIDEHVHSGRRDSIHRAIYEFVAQTVASRITEMQGDLVLDEIIGLIRLHTSIGS